MGVQCHPEVQLSRRSPEVPFFESGASNKDTCILFFMYLRLRKRIGRKILVSYPLNAFGKLAVCFNELLYGLPCMLKWDIQPYRHWIAMQCPHPFAQPSQITLRAVRLLVSSAIFVVSKRHS